MPPRTPVQCFSTAACWGRSHPRTERRYITHRYGYIRYRMYVLIVGPGDPALCYTPIIQLRSSVRHDCAFHSRGRKAVGGPTAGGRGGRRHFPPQTPAPAGIPRCGRRCSLQRCEAASCVPASAVHHAHQQRLLLIRSIPKYLCIFSHLYVGPGSALVHAPRGSLESRRIVRRSLPRTADRGLTLLHFPIARHRQGASARAGVRGKCHFSGHSYLK